MPDMTPQRLTLVTVAIAILAVAGILAWPRLAGGSGPTVAADDFAGQPRLGDPAAPVTVAVFEDFRCPACGQFEASVFPPIKREYVDTGRANVVFVNFVVLGQQSEYVARLGECVQRQSVDAFWDMKSPVYRAQAELDDPRRARELVLTYAPGVDAGELDRCMADESSLAAVRDDTQLAQRLGLRGTPSVLVNGQQVQSPTLDAVRRAIDAELD
jgi:protein-disulfide isomerase